MQETEGNFTDKKGKAQEAKDALDSMKKHSDKLRKAIRCFMQRKLHCELGYEDSDSGLRKCLKEELEDESLYSTLCRWLQSFYVERSLKLDENKWPLTVLLAFYKYEEDGWKKIYKKLCEQSNTSMKGFEEVCRELLRDREIKLKREPKPQVYEKIADKFKEIMAQLDKSKITEIINELQILLSDKSHHTDAETR